MRFGGKLSYGFWLFGIFVAIVVEFSVLGFMGMVNYHLRRSLWFVCYFFLHFMLEMICISYD